MEEAERKAREEAELKVKEEEERKAKEELERKAAEAADSASGQVRASLTKDKPEATVKLLNSFPVENGPAQRMSYLMEVKTFLCDPSVRLSSDFSTSIRNRGQLTHLQHLDINIEEAAETVQCSPHQQCEDEYFILEQGRARSLSFIVEGSAFNDVC